MLQCRAALRAVMCMSMASAPLLLGAQPSSGNGFLFGAPSGSLTLRAGLTQPTAGSEVFTFSHDHLTLGRGDFAGSAVSGELAVFVTQRAALQVSVGMSSRVVGSEFRDWVDNNKLPIEQTTVLRRLPIMLGLRYYLAPPGRSLGTLAWVPARMAPFVSAGVGRVWYRFRQSGDFVDFQTLDVFASTLESSGWTTSGYGAAGLDYSLSAKFGLLAEARYDVASAKMSTAFSGFDRIDLSGVSATMGLTFRF